MGLNIYFFVGLILLIGIVKKNAITRRSTLPWKPSAAKANRGRRIYEGCLVRFRPIMMTTAGALFGALPIALGFPSGRRSAPSPLGLCVVGGLMFSHLSTLCLTPVVYTYLPRCTGRLTRRDARSR